jgi:hypothetical protein
MSRRLLIVCAIALLHGAFFIWYQRPDWNTEWSDQQGYKRLGEVLAATGKFTRYPESATFIPEVIRTPLYPMFVAAVYRVAGVSQLAVAIAQTFVFAATCLLVFATARRLVAEPIAVAAAAATALFSPLPYFGALVMTELWTAFLFTAAMWATIRALQMGAGQLGAGQIRPVQIRARGAFALAGVLFGLTALSRPVFALFPIAVALVGLILVPLGDAVAKQTTPSGRPTPSAWLILAATGMLTLVPWLAYNEVYLGRVTMSPAGGIGRGIWEGSWPGTWSGRIQSELTSLAEDTPDRATLDAGVEATARREHLDPGPMLEYVHQWTDIRRIWTEPTDPVERTTARIAADQEYLRVGLANIRHQSAGHLARRLVRGVFILWAADIPFRYSTINQLPPVVIHLCWAIQAAIMLAALWGLGVLARRGRVVEAWILAAPIVYVTAVHCVLLTESRQSLPAKPDLLLVAVIGMAALLPFKPKVHERQHL